MIGSVLGIVLAYPIFWMIASGSVVLLYAGMIIGMPIVQSAVYGPSAAFISEMFRTEYRYTGASISYQTASTLGGGLSPLIAVTLAAVGGFAWCRRVRHGDLRAWPADPPPGARRHQDRSSERRAGVSGGRWSEATCGLTCLLEKARLGRFLHMARQSVRLPAGASF